MPELPDVESFKKYLDSTSLNQKINEVKITRKRILEKISEEKLVNKLKKNKFFSSHRHGKYLFVKLKKHWLMLHFGMTGKLKYFKKPEEKPKHTRMLVKFSSGFNLAYDCQRLLGKISIIKDINQYLKQKNLGPDALDIDFSDFYSRYKDRRGKIKSGLMNQKIIAGIGNIYADEILFQTGIHPETKLNNINKAQLKIIY
ncbi:MAG: DNA-formamidopyrimidine glycosylase family protein, partial [Candidatus Thermoplasmatota archaeon]